MARFTLEWMSLVCLLTGAVLNWSLSYKTTEALECHCISGCAPQCNRSSGCTRGWSGPTCQRNNLALDKGTDQSTTVDDCKWADTATKKAKCGRKDSSLAVDGTRSTRYWSGTCTHTAEGQREALWTVDLGQIHQIYDIKIYFPNSATTKRMEGFTVTVDGKLCYRQSSGDSLKPPLSIRCTRPINGSKVLIRAHQEEFILNLCEVEVYECADGLFGGKCNRHCNCRDPAEVCDKVTGHCQRGCVDGYKGKGCQTECTRGKYGAGCNESCGKCAGRESCNHVTGRCVGGCLGNWTGEQCKACEDGRYGSICSGTCGRCLNEEVCNKTDGKCSGCEEGFLKPFCQDCRQGHYGHGCRRCGQCLDNSPCDKQTGRCAEGCQPGWKGDNCHEACEDGRYGSICSGTCGRCLNEVCNKTNGKCSGCEEGFLKPFCQACEDGRYGSICSDACGRCLNEVCNKIDGKCSGCEEGFLEPLCQDCRDGHYGPECRRCGHCLDNFPCDKQTGRCAEGCQPGWKGDNCHEGCVGSYGYNCNETCGQCLGGVLCDPQTGDCPGGCHAGYEGQGCLAPKAEPSSSVLTPVLVVVMVLLLVSSVVGVYLYRRRSRRDYPQPVVMATLQIDNAHGHGYDQEGPPRQSPYRTDPTGGDQNYDDTYMNVESNVVQVPDLHHYIGKRVDKFASEYLRFRRGLQFPSQVAELDGNNGKNRFKQMYPYDHSRVVLTKLPQLKHSDYINASYIDGYNARKEYIASQGPNPLTIGDFWRMVWQKQSPIIVMLTRLTEGKRNKCAEYWPEIGGSVVRGDLQVTCTSSREKADFIIRDFTVHNTKIDQRHHVTQLHFMSWPDHGVPSAPVLVRFWKLFRSLVTRQTEPFIIHCSAGVGRTGTFIALDNLVKEARETNQLNVFECVRKMRENRVSMVQTEEQYHFLHLVVLEALRSETTHMTPSTFEGRFKSDTMNAQEEEALLQEEWKNIKDLQSPLADREVSASLLGENIKKSRMKKHFPPDALRPKLVTPVPDTNDYINAVFIPSEYNGQGLVVTQLPLPWTVVDFWRLVIDHNVHTVVSLEPLQREKPDDEGTYWPETKKEMCIDPFTVSKVSFRTRQITEVSLQVWQKESAESTNHDVTLLLTDGWAESKDTPSNISNFLHLITRVGMQETSPPVVVMCRNGSTKCGLFCAVLNIIQRLKSDSEIDIFLLIRQLQTFRPGFIQSYEQYKFCYRMVKEYQRTVNAVYENL